MISGEQIPKAFRLSDLVYYQKHHFAERLKADTHARYEDLMATWKAEGSVEDAKPEFLDVLRSVSREHWQRETPEFRAEVHAANEAEYEARAAEAKTRAEEELASRKPSTPAQYDR